MHRRCARMTSVGRSDAQVFVLVFLLLSYQNIFEIGKNNFAKNFINYSRNISSRNALFAQFCVSYFLNNLNLCFINRLFLPINNIT